MQLHAKQLPGLIGAASVAESLVLCLHDVETLARLPDQCMHDDMMPVSV